MNRVAILAEAQSWLGTPYHHMARVKGVGVDCAQFMLAVFQGVGLMPSVDVGFYTHDWHFHRSEEQYKASVVRYARQVAQPQPGDIALFKFARCVSHGAIVIAWPKLIHSYHRQGVVFGDANGAELGGRVDSFYSLVPETAP